MKPNRKVYRAPAIVYEGKVSTRAGSAPTTTALSDPGNLFGK